MNYLEYFIEEKWIGFSSLKNLSISYEVVAIWKYDCDCYDLERTMYFCGLKMEQEIGAICWFV